MRASQAPGGQEPHPTWQLPPCSAQGLSRGRDTRDHRDAGETRAEAWRHLCGWKGEGRKKGDGGCSRTTTLPVQSGCHQSVGLDSGGGGLSDALGPGQKQGQADGWHSDPRVLELGDSSGAGRTGPFLDIY